MVDRSFELKMGRGAVSTFSSTSSRTAVRRVFELEIRRENTFTWIATTSRGIRDSTYDRSNFAGLFEERGNSDTQPNRSRQRSGRFTLPALYIIIIFRSRGRAPYRASLVCLA